MSVVTIPSNVPIPGAPKIIGFLQNQWMSRPDYWRAKFAACTPTQREDLIRRLLFFRCQTGKRLRNVFGEKLCDHIVWENVSKEIGDHPRSSFGIDETHICEVVRRHKPEMIVLFGKVAWDATGLLCREFRDQSGPTIQMVLSPHPAARHKGCGKSLLAVRGHIAHQFGIVWELVEST